MYAKSAHLCTEIKHACTEFIHMCSKIVHKRILEWRFIPLRSPKSVRISHNGCFFQPERDVLC